MLEYWRFYHLLRLYVTYRSSVLNDTSHNPFQAILIALHSILKDNFLCDPVLSLPTLTRGRGQGEINFFSDYDE